MDGFSFDSYKNTFFMRFSSRLKVAYMPVFFLFVNDLFIVITQKIKIKHGHVSLQ